MAWYIITKQDLRNGDVHTAYRWEDGSNSIELTDAMVGELVECVLSQLVPQDEVDPEGFEYEEEDVEEEQIEEPIPTTSRSLKDLMQSVGTKSIADEDGVTQG